MNAPIFAALRAALRDNAPVALATVVATDPGSPETVRVTNKLLIQPHHEPLGSLGSPDLDRVVGRDALAELDAGRSSIRHYGPMGETTPNTVDEMPVVGVFIESWSPPPVMWIFGAVDFTAALARASKTLGYRVVVIDARPVFATAQRFPMASEVRVEWPSAMFAQHGATLTERDAVCILTHDPKFDVPAVVGALGTEVGYIGVMGSRRTHERRLARLREAGVTTDDLDRLMSPIGLDIGARSPEETAISILAEIIADRTGKPAPSLRDGSGPIH